MAGILDTLIFDRTQLDINRARYLNSLWDARAQRWTGTQEEWAEWEAGTRGAYGWNDMNRVTDAVSYLVGQLAILGYTVDMKNITPAYNVTVLAFPVEGGKATGTGTYYEGDLVTVSAENGTDYDFVGWMQDGEIVSTDLEYTFTIEQSITLTATFALKQFSVEVSVEPVEGGEATGAGTYDIGTKVTVAATAGEYYVFTKWTENGEEVAKCPEYTFALTESRSLTAVMTRLYVITLSTNNDNFGTVTGGGTYLDGQTVTLSAVAADGYGFSGWQSGGEIISTDPVYTFSIKGDMDFVAVFAKEVVISLDVFPAEYGTVTGAGKYLDGEQVTIKATAGNQYRFVYWTDEDPDIPPPPLKQYTINVTVTGFPSSLSAAGVLMVAGQQITSQGLTKITTTYTEIEISFTLTRSISTERKVSVNNELIGTVKTVGETATKIIPSENEMDVKISFTT